MLNDQRPTILALGIVFPIIAIVAVALRFHARRLKKLRLEADDWTIVAALILGIGVTIDVLLMSKLGGLGTHSQYTADGDPADPEAVVIFGKTTWVLEVLTWPAVGMNKISVLLLYKRIFATTHFKKMVWVLVAGVIAWTITFTLALMLSCLLIASQWNFSLNFHCVNQQVLFTVALGTDVATDGLVLLLPVYKVCNLHMPFGRKLIVIFIFLLGGLVTVVGIIRIHFVTLIYDVLLYSPEADTTWLYSQAFYWTIIETNVGVLSACLPTLRLLQERYPLKPLFSRIKTSVTNLLSSSGRTSGIRIGSEEDELASGDNRRLHNETEEVTPHPSNSNSDLRGYQTQAGLNKDTFRSVRLT